MTKLDFGSYGNNWRPRKLVRNKMDTWQHLKTSAHRNSVQLDPNTLNLPSLIFKDPDTLAEKSIRDSSRMDSGGSEIDSPLYADNRKEPRKAESTFIDIYKDADSKFRRGRTIQMHFYDTLAQRYKYLLKLSEEDENTSFILKKIENQVFYGNNVKIFRIINGIIQEVLQDNYTQMIMKELDSVETDVGESRFNSNTNKEEEYKILKSRLKTKNDLRKLIDEIPFPASVSAIKPVSVRK